MSERPSGVQIKKSIRCFDLSGGRIEIVRCYPSNGGASKSNISTISPSGRIEVARHLPSAGVIPEFIHGLNPSGVILQL
jgi:hypothetical protein